MEITINTSTALIVDDEPAVARSVARLLSRRGYVCQTANTPQEARECLREASFDLVVSDLHMPGGNGIDFLRHVVSSYPDAATVILTGFGDPVSEGKAQSIGVDAYMTKKADDEVIKSSLEKALINKALRLALAAA